MPDEWLVAAASGSEARYSTLKSVSLALLAALQTLPPRQRAVLISIDVRDWPARDAAELLELTVSSVNSAFHRAQVRLAGKYHGQPAEVAARPVTNERMRRRLDRYVRAWQSADVAWLVALLKEETTFSMPPSPT